MGFSYKYEKTIIKEITGNNSGNWQSIDSSFGSNYNVKDIISLNCIHFNGTEYENPYFANDNYKVRVNYNNGDLRTQIGNNMATPRTFYVTVKYTKNTT